jgi:hypothetical protein
MQVWEDLALVELQLDNGGRLPPNKYPLQEDYLGALVKVSSRRILAAHQRFTTK